MSTLVLLASSERWYLAAKSGHAVAIHAISETLDISPSEVVARLVNQAESTVPHVRTLVICPPPDHFVAAPLSEAGVPSRDRSTTLLYRFEEVLPLAAEDLVADFASSSIGVLGIGVIQLRITPLLDALRPRGFRILAICPAALLAAKRVLRNQPLPATTVLEFDSGLSMHEIVALNDGIPTAWGHFEAGSDEAAGFLTEYGLRSDAVTSREFIPLERYLEDAAQEAFDIVNDQAPFPANTRPLHEIQQDRTAALQVPLRVLIASAALLALSLMAVNVLELRRANDLARGASDRELVAFHSIFPGQAPPPNIRSRLESAAIQARQVARETSHSTQQVSALGTLSDFLECLPKEVRFRVNELRVSGTTVQLSGHVPSHVDADQLARGVAARFSVAPLRTELLSNRVVSFAVSANLQAQSGRGESATPDAKGKQ